MLENGVQVVGGSNPLAPTNIPVGRSDSRPGVLPATGRSAGKISTGHFTLPPHPLAPTNFLLIVQALPTSR